MRETGRGGCGAETGRGCGQKREETVTAKAVIRLQKPEKLGDWFFPRVSGGNRPSIQFRSVQFSRSVITPWTAAATGFPVHHQFLEFTRAHVH